MILARVFISVHLSSDISHEKKIKTAWKPRTNEPEILNSLPNPFNLDVKGLTSMFMHNVTSIRSYWWLFFYRKHNRISATVSFSVLNENRESAEKEIDLNCCQVLAHQNDFGVVAQSRSSSGRSNLQRYSLLRNFVDMVSWTVWAFEAVDAETESIFISRVAGSLLVET